MMTMITDYICLPVIFSSFEMYIWGIVSFSNVHLLMFIGEEVRSAIFPSLLGDQREIEKKKPVMQL